jgi:thioesterase domain-containing protein/acyl carrier protein
MEMLCRIFADVLQVDRIGVTDNFFEAGGDSLGVIKLVVRIRAAFGVRIGPELIFQHPTALAVAEHLEIDSDGGDALNPLLVMRSHGSRPPLFCVHPGGGLGWCYTPLLGAVDTERPIMVLQSRGLRPGEIPARGGIPEMVEDYLGLIRQACPRGPYHLLGWSFGGTVAHALACRLQAEGETVGALAVMDAAPTAAGESRVPSTRELMISVLQEFGYDLRDLASVPLRPDRVVHLLQRENSAMAYLEPAHVHAVLEVFANNQRSVRGHRPGTFDGDLEFFSALDEGAVDPGRWSAYITGDVRLHPLSGTHRNIARPEHLAEVARVLDALLNEGLRTS